MFQLLQCVTFLFHNDLQNPATTKQAVALTSSSHRCHILCCPRNRRTVRSIQPVESVLAQETRSFVLSSIFDGFGGCGGATGGIRTGFGVMSRFARAKMINDNTPTPNLAAAVMLATINSK